MMKQTLTRATLITAFLGATGCSSLFGPEGFFRDRGEDYLNAEVMKPIELPEGASDERIGQLYVIPPATETAFNVVEKFEVPRPQPLSMNAFSEHVKIQKLGNESWILVAAAPAGVWPQVRAFLGQNNLEVVFENPSSGIIETAWLKFQDDQGTKDKYRIKIEQGVQPDSTEIHILHISVDENIPGRGQVNWPKQSVSSERESWMRDELATAIATNPSSQAASLMAQTIASDAKVDLDMEGDEPILTMTLDSVRAWATIEHAVQQEGFTLWQADDSVGIFYVGYEPVVEQDEPGFLSRWLGLGNDEPLVPSTPYSLDEVLGHLQLESTAVNRKIFNRVQTVSPEPLDNVPGYLIVVRGYNGEIEVRIRDGYAQLIPKKEARKLLSIVRHNLI